MWEGKNIRLLGASALICVGFPAFADHIAEDLFLTAFQTINKPYCEFLNESEGTTNDCDTPDAAMLQCWQDRLHLYYDEASLRDLIAETEASNAKYKYFNEPYYNEFFSNLNWDNILDISDRC